MSPRFKVLFYTCVGLFGQFYAFDNPSALADQLKKHFTNTPATENALSTDEFAFYFNMLYTVYSLPNIVLPLLLGYVIDISGIRTSVITLSTIVFAGSVIVALGMWLDSFGLMLFGRFVFGIGGESLQVAQSALLYKLFRGEEVAFALGVNLSVARAGSVLNDVVSPFLCDRFGLHIAMGFGAVMVGFSYIANVWSVSLNADVLSTNQVLDARPKINFQFPSQCWILVFYSCFIYSAILPFNNIATAFFVESRGETHQSAGNALAMLFLVSAVVTPLFGYFVDHVGNRTFFLFVAAVVLAASHSMVFYIPPAAVCMLIGIVYMVFVAVVWPTIGLAVSEEQLGSAYGMATSVQSLGVTVVTMIVAELQGSSIDATQGYHYVASLFAGLGLVGMVAASMLHQHPEANSLNMPSFTAKSEKARLSARHLTAYAAIPSKYRNASENSV